MRHSLERIDPRRAALVLLALAFGCSHILASPAAQAPGPQPVATADENASLSQAQLEQLLAPVALFPDELLMQLLMAATYPLEIVQAQRWLGQAQHAALRGDALAQALEAQGWDPSVKSLVPFPDLLKMMSDQLAWTQQLGDAVLAQQEDVLNAIQVLRGRAHLAGKLESGPQQIVTVTQNLEVSPMVGVVAPPPQIITIAPANPTVVFVPVYNPNVVFGTWPWPSHPPVFIPPPPGWGMANALLTGMAFAAGVAVVGSLWGWARPAWGRGYANINVNRFNTINVNRTQINNNRWQHNAVHRHGVAYSNREVNNRFRGDTNVNRTVNRDQSRDQFRGRAEQIQREGGLGANRPGGVDRPNLGASRPSGGQGAGAGLNRPTTLPSGRPNPPQQRPQTRPAGLDGVGQGRDVRAAAQRGQASRQAPPVARQHNHGAAARPAGGARAGGAGPHGGGRQGR